MRQPKRPPVFTEDGYMLIRLTQGHSAIIDLIDAKQARHNWCALVRPNQPTYAVRNIPTPDGPHPQRMVYLHRQILGVADPAIHVDHRDGDGLNCRRFNLREASPVINGRNRGLPRNNKSGHKGVHWDTRRKRWCARLADLELGCFRDLNDAVAARLKAEREVWGVEPQRLAAYGVSHPMDLDGLP